MHLHLNKWEIQGHTCRLGGVPCIGSWGQKWVNHRHNSGEYQWPYATESSHRFHHEKCINFYLSMTLRYMYMLLYQSGINFMIKELVNAHLPFTGHTSGQEPCLVSGLYKIASPTMNEICVIYKSSVYRDWGWTHIWCVPGLQLESRHICTYYICTFMSRSMNIPRFITFYTKCSFQIVTKFWTQN